MALTIDIEFLMPPKLPGPPLTYNLEISPKVKFFEFKKSFNKINNLS